MLSKERKTLRRWLILVAIIASVVPFYKPLSSWGMNWITNINFSSLIPAIPQGENISEPKEKPKTIDELCSSIRNPKKMEVTLRNEWSKKVPIPNMTIGKRSCITGPAGSEIMDSEGNVYPINADIDLDIGMKAQKFGFRGPVGEKVTIIYE